MVWVRRQLERHIGQSNSELSNLKHTNTLTHIQTEKGYMTRIKGQSVFLPHWNPTDPAVCHQGPVRLELSLDQ